MNKHLNVALATAIIESRRKKKTIARLARINPSSFSQILHGWMKPNRKHRAALARVLGKSESELFDAAEPEKVGQ